MKGEISLESAKAMARSRAAYDFALGLGHEENPYPAGGVMREAYMMEMARLQQNEFNELNRSLQVAIYAD